MSAHRSHQSAGTSNVREEAGFYRAYAEFARTLRTWFIAYGIGAPVLVLSNKDLWDTVKSSGSVLLIAVLFLLGVTFQVVEAFIYKTAMWHLYVGESDDAHKNTWWYRLSGAVSVSYALELFLDIGALVLFAVATILLVKTLL